MANVRVELSPRNQETREAIIAEMTEVMIKYGSPRESTQVMLFEVSHDLWGKGGLTYTKRAEIAAAEAATATPAEA